MLATYHGLHAGEPIAVLGSGPSLRRFRGQQPIAIAVNGAALYDVPYQYFACGDAGAPWCEWFYGSRRFGARRLVASFVAPRDAVLFPRASTRYRLRAQRLPRGLAARLHDSMAPLYDYAPRARPAAGHGWFQYATPEFPSDAAVFRDTLRGGRVLHGASIAGVAVQIALTMGAAAIHLYGCAMDNDAGGNYFAPGSRGRTTPRQRAHFAALLGWVEHGGVEVVRHG
ncbi:MAG: hypothetical protein SF182_19025 [Deltaproteobacteria bacterium]|nr:hypothetical protein [Deltaproteobacteria bacterium]